MRLRRVSRSTGLPLNLGVPDQIVAYDEHVVLLAEGNVFIRQVERVVVGRGMDERPLEDVFRRDGVELRGEEGIGAGVAAGDLGFVNGRADVKQTAISAL